MIENGLNLPAKGGIPVIIDGTTYYYAIDIKNGELYEYWFDADGNLIWGRHHTAHKKPWKHDDPHDHKGGKDEKGNNTLVDGPQPVDEKFHGPNQLTHQRENDLNVGNVAASVAVGVVIYQIAKWTIVTLLAPVTGGGSYTVAVLTP